MVRASQHDGPTHVLAGGAASLMLLPALYRQMHRTASHRRHAAIPLRRCLPDALHDENVTVLCSLKNDG